MKTIILILISIVGYMQTSGQEGYQSFFGSNTTKYHIFEPMVCSGTNGSDSVNTNLLVCGFTHEYIISKENTIMVNDTVYYQAWDNSWDVSTELFIREDTAKGQLFRYIKELDREYLICDMSLNVGDTFTLPDWEQFGWIYYYQEGGANTIVDSIIYVNNKKVIYFSAMPESYYYSHVTQKNNFSLS